MTTRTDVVDDPRSRYIRYGAVILSIFALYSALFLFFLNAVHQRGDTTESFISITQRDSEGYVLLGHALLDTGSFSVPSYDPYLGYVRTPAYPLFIAVVVGIFHNDVAVPFVQFLLVGISAIFIFLLGKRFASPTVGLVAAILYVVDPITLFLSFYTMSETFFVCVFLSTIILLTSERSSLTKTFGAGLLMGTAILTRPIALYAVAVFLLWFVLDNRKEWRTNMVRTVIFFVVGVALVIVPWMVRNYVATGHFSISSAGPYSVLMFFIPEFEHYRTGMLPDQVREQIYQQLGVADTSAAGTLLHGFSYVAAEQKLTLRYVLRAPFLYSVYHIASTGPFFFGSDIYSVQNWLTAQGIFVTEKVNVNHSYLLYTGHFMEFFKTITANIPQLIERIVWFLLFVGSVVAVIHAIITRSRSMLLALLFSALILTFAILTGPLSQPRYRMPAAPFLFILGVTGLGIIFSYVKTRISYGK